MRLIADCLNTQLTSFWQKTALIDALNAKFLTCLPDHLRAHCRAGNITNGCLTLLTTDSVWATELRYLVPELRDTLRREAGLYQLASIKIVLEHPEAAIVQPAKKATTQRTISKTALTSLQSAHDQCDDPTLKEALQRLANTMTQYAG